MRKKILSLFMAITVLCLNGCGSNSTVGGNILSGETTPKNILESSSPTIGYLVKMVDKDSVPQKILIFQNKQVLEYDTNYTMGELSKMTDAEIIENIDKAAREKIIENIKQERERTEELLEEKQSAYDEEFTPPTEQFFIWCNVWEYWDRFNRFRCDEYYGEELVDFEEWIWNETVDILTNSEFAVGERTFEEVIQKEIEAGNITDDIDERLCAARKLNEKFLEFAKEDMPIEEERAEEEEKERKKNIEEEIASLNSQISELDSQEKNVTFNSEEAIINLITDSTGNDMKEESIVWKGGKLLLNPLVDAYLKDGAVVYDSIYYGYGSTAEANYLMIRSSKKSGFALGFDDMNTKGIYVDLSENEVNEILNPSSEEINSKED